MKHIYFVIIFILSPYSHLWSSDNIENDKQSSQTGVVATIIGSVLGSVEYYDNDPFGPATGTMADLPPTDQKRVDQLYYILKNIDEILKKHHIPYTLFSGSLLGAIRHGGLIPWDDDADIAVSDEFLGNPLTRRSKIFTLEKDLNQRGLGLRPSPFGIQVYFLRKDLYTFFGQNWFNNIQVGYKDAFVDIFPLKEDKKGLLQVKYLTYYLCPNEYISKEALAQTQDTKFGHLILQAIPRKEALEYLTRAYGQSWPNTAYKTFSHTYMRGTPLENKVRLESKDDFSYAISGNEDYLFNHAPLYKGGEVNDGFSYVLLLNETHDMALTIKEQIHQEFTIPKAKIRVIMAEKIAHHNEKKITKGIYKVIKTPIKIDRPYLKMMGIEYVVDGQGNISRYNL